MCVFRCKHTVNRYVFKSVPRASSMRQEVEETVAIMQGYVCIHAYTWIHARKNKYVYLESPRCCLMLGKQWRWCMSLSYHPAILARDVSALTHDTARAAGEGGERVGVRGREHAFEYGYGEVVWWSRMINLYTWCKKSSESVTESEARLMKFSPQIDTYTYLHVYIYIWCVCLKLGERRAELHIIDVEKGQPQRYILIYTAYIFERPK